ncbi:hypothetical protein ANA_P10085 (plasmid) [Anabaena sp. 90]|uniref:hypothetical protein n=1 Tax=Anabaena sp. 90 TaxID=46234 RepID=UPI00029B6C1A|nr:hypothetical protein [Anabaena sp. 90]AFW97251.1 hypothetical protein ANA_P10085 [Anabaena sp. 90]
MKITMLGNQYSGKTCYMLGMYAFMSMGLKGFTLTATDPDQDLRLMDQWEALIGDNILPPPTQPQSQDSPIYTYGFSFNHGAKPLIDFEWIDYRGGALAGDSSQADATFLRQKSRQSDCLFLCVPAEYLQEEIVNANGDVNNRVKLKVAGSNKLAINRINLILTEIKQAINEEKNDGQPVPIAIVITKFDLIFGKRNKEAITRDIQELFNPLFIENSGWLTMICPVSLGKDIRIEDKKILGEIDPVNVHLPLVFAIYSQLTKDVSTVKSSYNNIQEQKTRVADDLKTQQGKWNSFFKQGEINSKQSSLNNKETELAKKEAEIQDISKKMQLVAKELDNVSMFLGNQEMKVSV